MSIIASPTDKKKHKFESLTKYLPQLANDSIGEWIIDRKNDGSPEHPKQMPFVNYTEMVHRFIEDVYAGSSAGRQQNHQRQKQNQSSFHVRTSLLIFVFYKYYTLFFPPMQ